MSTLVVSPEMVKLNQSYDSDCARAVWDFLRRQADQGRTVQVVATERTFSPAEVAGLVGVSRPTVHRRIQDGTIKAVRRGSRWRVTEAEVDRYRMLMAGQMAEMLGDGLDF
ncbi:MAG: helix-turn-helix domain-containing protein [Bifidobacteriaceae bacterium]|jgi:excisionase family DNA binding protein|nr:helix-turn-helix domain-containing protein [Bifidobacteriaceae bacterium]